MWMLGDMETTTVILRTALVKYAFVATETCYTRLRVLRVGLLD
jgi:hypothetical protein